MVTEPQTTEISGWTIRFRQPVNGNPIQVIFLIHGWTGDENSMWVFASQLPKDTLLIAPRAPYVSKHPVLDGYSWVTERGESFSSIKQFYESINSFDQLIPDLATKFSADLSTFSMVGFSQGSAFCVAYALSHPESVSKLAMLAGFLPGNADLGNLAGKPVFIAHGTKDETVPVALAREAQTKLAASGAKVRYCESEIGHKLGANCFHELGEFFAK